jgi:hypothetical protein
LRLILTLSGGLARILAFQARSKSRRIVLRSPQRLPTGRQDIPVDQAESEAKAFAGEFLFPEEVIRANILVKHYAPASPLPRFVNTPSFCPAIPAQSHAS